MPSKRTLARPRRAVRTRTVCIGALEGLDAEPVCHASCSELSKAGFCTVRDYIARLNGAAKHEDCAASNERKILLQKLCQGALKDLIAFYERMQGATNEREGSALPYQQ